MQKNIKKCFKITKIENRKQKQAHSIQSGRAAVQNECLWHDFARLQKIYAGPWWCAAVRPRYTLSPPEAEGCLRLQIGFGTRVPRRRMSSKLVTINEKGQNSS